MAQTVRVVAVEQDACDPASCVTPLDGNPPRSLESLAQASVARRLPRRFSDLHSTSCHGAFSLVARRGLECRSRRLEGGTSAASAAARAWRLIEASGMRGTPSGVTGRSWRLRAERG